jgi:hypothetical protein
MADSFETQPRISQAELEAEAREWAFLEVVGDNVDLLHVDSYELPLDEITPEGGKKTA